MFVLVACLALAAPTAAMAQAKKGDPEKPKPEDLKGYTLPYFFTLIGFLAVVVSVGMTSGRTWDFRVAEEED
jgi:hypothetical protein